LAVLHQGVEMKLRIFPLLILLVICCLFNADCRRTIPPNADSESKLLTLFERSDGAKTPRYTETVAYCRQLAETFEQLHYRSFGESPQGRELPLLILNNQKRFTPEAVRKRDGQTVVLIEACIHAGESCGKDAGLMLMRDLVDGYLPPALTENVTVLFIPILSVDGHERFSSYGRINQNGPEEMGWRVTARNLNLNRDFLKADCMEMQAWLRLYNDWLPELFFDIHSTDGADWQYPILYQICTHGNIDAGVADWNRDYGKAMEAAMAAEDYPMAPYMFLAERNNPRSGFYSWAAGPRYSQGYAAIQNRSAVLVETHMLKDYATRVESTYQLLASSLAYLQTEGAQLRDAIHIADERCALGIVRETPYPVGFESLDETISFDFLGVEYEAVTSDLTGGNWYQYSDRPVTFAVPIYDKKRPSLTIELPALYIVPPEWREVIDRMALHGIKMHRLSEAKLISVETCRFKNIEWGKKPYEGRQTVEYESEPRREDRLLPAGTVLIDLNQRAALAAAHCLEPQAPDAFVGWGFFNTIFQRVEYAESYVLEQKLREAIDADPELKNAFFAYKEELGDEATPYKLLMWFYRQTPYYDQRAYIYPVAWIWEREGAEALLELSDPID
jgi:Zinc carboxypeptidase